MGSMTSHGLHEELARSVRRIAGHDASFIHGVTLAVDARRAASASRPIELAARAGAGAVGVTTSSAERGKRLRSLGATHILGRAGAGDESVPDVFDAFIDIVSGPGLPSFIRRLAPNSQLVTVGVVVGHPPADFGMAILGALALHALRSQLQGSLSSKARDASLPGGCGRGNATSLRWILVRAS